MSDFHLVSQSLTVRDTPRIEYVAIHNELTGIALEQGWGNYGEDRVIVQSQLWLSPSAVRALHKALTCAVANEGNHGHFYVNDDLELVKYVEAV